MARNDRKWERKQNAKPKKTRQRRKLMHRRGTAMYRRTNFRLPDCEKTKLHDSAVNSVTNPHVKNQNVVYSLFYDMSSKSFTRNKSNWSLKQMDIYAHDSMTYGCKIMVHSTDLNPATLFSLGYLVRTCLWRKAWAVCEPQRSKCYHRHMACRHQTARIRKAVLQWKSV